MWRRITFIFYPAGKQRIVKTDPNRIAFIRDLTPSKERVAYSFGLSDHSIVIDFYDERGKLSNFVPIEVFFDLHFELSKNRFNFSKECLNSECISYYCETNFFDINFKNNSFDPFELTIEVERFDIYRGSVLYRLTNHNLKNKTILKVCSVSSGQKYELPLIPFTSKKEIIERLNKLLILL